MDILNVIKQYKKNKLTKKRIIDLLSAKGFQGTTVYYIKQDNDVVEMEIGLPPHKELINVKTQLLRNLQQEFQAEDSEISLTNGKFITMRFGTRKLYKKHDWSYKSLIPYINTLKVEFPSSYGHYVVDFEASESCHGAIAGTSGFGKSTAVIYILTQLYLQNSGNLEIHISSIKLDDFYPFIDCKNIYTSENADELMVELTNIEKEYESRKKRLRKLLHATDSKSVRKYYPEEYKHFKPIFLFIDEFARFSDNDDIVALVEKLVAVTRYINIHIFVLSQRVDSLNVLTPLIRINLPFRLGFWVENKGNSELIIGRSGCENLPKIAGRGILVDKEQCVVHIPYLDLIDCYDLLKPFRKSGIHEGKRSESDSTITEIQSNDTQPNSLPGVSECELSNSDSKSDIETFIPTWTD